MLMGRLKLKAKILGVSGENNKQADGLMSLSGSLGVAANELESVVNQFEV